MANSAEIADLLTRGMQGPTGPEDAAFHTGVVKSWDRTTGINVVTINGVDVSNVKALQGGIPNWFTAGDVVVIIRKQTQYFIMGKVSSPAGAAGSGPGRATSNFVNAFDTGGAWADNPSFPNTPQVSVYIGNSKSVIILWQCNVKVSSGDPAAGGGIYNANVVGEVGWEISGATTQAAGAFSGTSASNTIQFGNPDPLQWVTSIVTLSGSYMTQILNPGFTTFTMKYKTVAGMTATFSSPVLTIIPL
jgi:hypothetical protein